MLIFWQRWLRASYRITAQCNRNSRMPLYVRKMRTTSVAYTRLSHIYNHEMMRLNICNILFTFQIGCIRWTSVVGNTFYTTNCMQISTTIIYACELIYKPTNWCSSAKRSVAASVYSERHTFSPFAVVNEFASLAWAILCALFIPKRTLWFAKHARRTFIEHTK